MKALWAPAAVFSIFSLAARGLEGLPAYQALFETKTRYGAGCGACHKPVSRRLTSYGREFNRLGRDAKALESLDLMDPDRDGLSSGVELRQRSNPGDPRSTPEHPGAWTTHEEPAPLPAETVKDVFGRPAGWSARSVALTREQVRQAESFLREKLTDAEKVPTVFTIHELLPAAAPPVPRPEPSAPLAAKQKRPRRDPWTGVAGTDAPPPPPPAEAPAGRRKGKVLATAGYAYFGADRLTVFVVFVSPEGKLIGVRPLTVRTDRRLAKDDYYRQYDGRSLDSLKAVEAPRGAEAANAELIAAVRRAAKILQAVQN